MRRYAIAAGVGIALAAGTLAYLTFRNEPGTAPASIEKLSVASATLPHTALLQIAAAKGYFADEGVDLTIVPTTHGKVAIEMLIAGKVDLATAAEVPFVLQVLAGQPLSIAASMLSAAEGKAVIGRRDRGISSPRDLQGKKVGVTVGASGEYFLWAYMIRQKVPHTSVTLVDVPPGRMAEVLSTGTVDAVATWEPVVFNVQQRFGERVVSFTDRDAYTELHVLVGHSEFFRSRPQAAQGMVRALLKAEQFTRAQPEAALQLVAARLQIDPESLRTTWKYFSFTVDLRQTHLITLEQEARWAMARGYFEQRPVPNFLEHLHLDALRATRPDRMTIVR
jgi:NitT/TauT family transport system substrate-binding protein